MLTLLLLQLRTLACKLPAQAGAPNGRERAGPDWLLLPALLLLLRLLLLWPLPRRTIHPAAR